MPATFVDACGTAGAVATRPAQAAQVVVPSAICVPQLLQKAIRPPQSLAGWPFAAKNIRHAASVRPLPSDAAARYQKAYRNAISNLKAAEKTL